MRRSLMPILTVLAALAVVFGSMLISDNRTTPPQLDTGNKTAAVKIVKGNEEEFFTSLSKAVASVSSQGVATIEVLQNLNETEQVVVDNGKQITIVAGKSEVEVKFELDKSLFAVSDFASLNIGSLNASNKLVFNAENKNLELVDGGFFHVNNALLSIYSGQFKNLASSNRGGVVFAGQSSHISILGGSFENIFASEGSFAYHNASTFVVENSPKILGTIMLEEGKYIEVLENFNLATNPKIVVETKNTNNGVVVAKGVANTQLELLQIFEHGSLLNKALFEEEQENQIVLQISSMVVLSLDSANALSQQGWSWNGQNKTFAKHITTSTLGELPQNISKLGFAFVGWFDGENEITSSTQILQNSNFVAKWEKVAEVYQVRYFYETLQGEYEEDTALMFEQTAEIGETVTAKTDEQYHRFGFELNLEHPLSKLSGDVLSEEALVLSVYYDLIVYNISYNLDGGIVEEDNPTTYTVATESFTLQNPSKYGFKFLGWTYNGQLEPVVDLEIAKGSAGHKNLVANWEEIVVEYKIEYYFEEIGSNNFAINNSLTEIIEEKVGESVSVPNPNAYEGTDFVLSTNHQDYKENGVVELENQLVLKIFYARKTYSIVFNSSNGVNVEGVNGTYKVGTRVDVSTIVLNGYKFERWVALTGETYEEQVFSIIVEKDMELDAQYALETYMVVFELDGGQITGNNPIEFNVETPTFVLPQATKPGKEFVGWQRGLNEPVLNFEILQGTYETIYVLAIWEDIVADYQVKYFYENLNDDNYTEDANLTQLETDAVGKDVFANTTDAQFAKEGFVLNEENSVLSGKVLQDNTLVLEVYFNRITFTANLQAGNGIESVSGDGEYKFGQTIIVQAVVSNGYTFAGWTGSENISENPHTIASINKNYTLTATAVAVDYLITYNLDGGVVALPNPSSYTIETETITLNNPTKENFNFLGWTFEGQTEPVLNVEIVKGSTGNKTFVANWEELRADYQVKYFYENVDSSNYTEDTTLTQLETDVVGKDVFANTTDAQFAKEGFVLNEESSVLSGKVLEDNTLVLEVYFNRITFTANLQAGNGIESVSGYGEYKFGQTIMMQAVVSNGYTFAGWTGSENISENPHTIASINKNYTLTATAVAVEYSITYNLNGGVVALPNPSSYTIETETFQIENPTKEGYNFVGWTFDGQTEPVLNVEIVKGSTGNKHFVANWEEYTYTLTLDPVGGFVNPTTLTVTVNSEIGILPTPTKIGYTFSKWQIEEIDITSETVWSYTSNQTANAVWTQNTNTEYKVEHYTKDLGEETYSLSQTENFTGTTDTTATASSVDIEHFTYDAAHSSTLASGTIAGDGSLVLRLYYTRNTYEILFVATEGISNITGNGTYEYGAEVKLTATVETGYTFQDWRTQRKAPFSLEINSPDNPYTFTVEGRKVGGARVDYTATAKLSTYNVTLVADQAAGDPFDLIAVTHFETGYAEELPTPVRAGYTFGGWALTWEPTSPIVINTGGNFQPSVSGFTNSLSQWIGTSDVTLVARWIANTYTVTFDKQSGTGGTNSVTVTFGSAMTPATKPTLTGYDFVGYYDSASGGTQYYDASMASTRIWDKALNATLYARWSLQTQIVTISLELNQNPAEFENLDQRTWTVSEPYQDATEWVYKLSRGITAASDGSFTFFESIGNGIPNPERTGYTFNGWFTQPVGGIKLTPSTSVPYFETSYYAQWTLNEKTVLINLISDGNPGSVPSPWTTVMQGGVMQGYSAFLMAAENGLHKFGNLPQPLKEGYSFLGWFTASNGAGAKIENTSSIPYNDATYYAHWEVEILNFNITVLVSKTESGIDPSTSHLVGYITPEYQEWMLDESNLIDEDYILNGISYYAFEISVQIMTNELDNEIGIYDNKDKLVGNMVSWYDQDQSLMGMGNGSLTFRRIFRQANGDPYEGGNGLYGDNPVPNSTYNVVFVVKGV